MQGIQDESTNEKIKISIEGNIGCGKTRLMNYLKNSKDLKLVPEPVEEWQNWHGQNLLEKFYDEPKKNAFAFQNIALYTSTKGLLSRMEESVKITERSPHSSHLFATKLRKDNILTAIEYMALKSWYNLLRKRCHINLDLVVYLKTLPEMAHARTIRRNRKEEKNISLEDHVKLSKLHDWWLLDEKICNEEFEDSIWPTGDEQHILKRDIKYKGEVLVLDGNKEGDEIIGEYEKLVTWIRDKKKYLAKIKGYRNNTEYTFMK